jgi:hypothetical protein
MSCFLIEASLAPSTLKKYKEAVKSFTIWCNDNDYDATDEYQLDSLLTEYFHTLYESNDGIGKGQASCTLHGIIKYMPRCANKLPSASMSLQGWLKLRPSQSHPPLTYDLAVLISCKMTMNGNISYAIGVLLAFECLLRIGELCEIEKGDIADAGDPRMGKEYSGTSIRLPKTKTGANQWVTVNDSDVVTLLRLLLSWTPNDTERIFSFSAQSFRSVFKDTCAQLGLSHQYVPHSLRHGGATRLHLQGWSIEDILLRGRWQSNKSARRYIQSGRAMLISTSVPKKIAHQAKTLASSVLTSLYYSLPQSH